MIGPGGCLSGRSAPIDAYDMSQWKGYGPDNGLPSDAGVADGPQAASAGALTYEPLLRTQGETVQPFHRSTLALYESSSRAVLDDLLSGIRRREGIMVLTGDMGTGKTTLCRAALYQLDRKTFTTFVPDPSCRVKTCSGCSSWTSGRSRSTTCAADGCRARRDRI